MRVFLRSSKLLGEELVPLLHRRELLQRERVDPAQQGEVTLGRPQPLLLLLADVRRGLRLGLSSASVPVNGTDSRLRSRRPARPARGRAPSRARSSSCSMRIFCWVRAISSRWTELTSSSCSRASSRNVARTASSCSSRPDRACSTSARAAVARSTDRSRAASTTRLAARTAPRGATLADQPVPPLGGLGASLPLGRGAAVELVGTAVQGSGALFGRTQGQARLHLRLARRPGGLDEILAAGGVGLLVRGVLGGGEPLLELGEAGQVASRASSAAVIASVTRAASARAARACDP